MESSFYSGNRARLWDMLKPSSAAVFFSGEEVRKTNDEMYPFFARRSFVYLTGITQKQSILVGIRDQNGNVQERLYLLPSDLMAERWTGKRLTKQEATARSGVWDVRTLDQFEKDFHTLAAAGHYSMKVAPIENLYLDVYRAETSDRDTPAHRFLALTRENYPYLNIENGDGLVRKLRLIKQPCEIEALRKAEEITGRGICAMMRASRPGMYEYQYKAVFDKELGWFGPEQHGFPPIISAGKNNFCIHYYSYTGQAQDGDMILNDVGAQWDDLIVDVSRGWPCNGKFTDLQAKLYTCALETSNHMFQTVAPGWKMADIDREIRSFNAAQLVKAGILQDESQIGQVMWHGGAHHIGFDVHDVVQTPEIIAPGMTFCIDVGIYHEESGIGFRLEDNLLVTENGCENLSAAIPRTIADIERTMQEK